MRALRPSSTVLVWALALGEGGLAGCGDGATAVHVSPDASVEAGDGGDAADVEAMAVDAETDAPVDVSEGSAADADVDAELDAIGDVADATDTSPT